MINDLQKMNLTNFNIRQRPNTEEHTNQKIQSLTGFDRFWFEVLQTRSFGVGGDIFAIDWLQPRFLATAILIQQYKAFDKNSERYASTQGQYISSRLAILCPSAKNMRGKNPYSDTQVRGYNLPNLAIARQEFEKAIGSPVEWVDNLTHELQQDYLTHEGAHP